MRSFKVVGACAAGATALAYAAYRKELAAARARLESGWQLIDAPHGPIEFAEAGDGPAVLFIHGAGGGFDQGLDLGAAFLGDGYRVVAPSRFGYLGTPVPADASPVAQADAHLRLLDALQLDRVPVIAVSAGGPSAMQLCLRHPERCSALVLVVPMPWSLQAKTDARLSPWFKTVLSVIASSDFLFWAGIHVAPAVLVRTILGTPPAVYESATTRERRQVGQVLRSILPISRRVAGIWNDGEVAANLTPFALERMEMPALVISAADDLYETYESALFTAGQIPNGRFIGFSSGGHLLLGHEAQVRSEITGFLEENRYAGMPAHTVL